jgi:hypothetical protein
MSNVDPDELYAILRSWATAKGGKFCSYSDLSEQYAKRTNTAVLPAHGTWDVPLGALNNRVHAIGAPAISALVVLREPPKEPGGHFWGSAPNVPPRPPTPAKRTTEWVRILTEVFAYKWPPTLP